MIFVTDGEWLIDLNKLESEYNKRRWNFRNKFKRYIRCNPYETNFTEEELIDDLKKLGDIRNQMKELSKTHNFKGSRPAPVKNNDLFSSRAAVPVWSDYEE